MIPSSTLRVLLLEGSDDDAAAVRRLLAAPSGTTAFDVSRVRRISEALAAISARAPDAILLGSPDGGAWLDFFIRLPADGPPPPVVFLSGVPDRVAETVALQAGAADCLAKSALSTTVLERAVCYAVERRRAAEAVEETESRLRSLTESMTDGALIIDQADRIVYANPAVEALFGWDTGTLAGQPLEETIPPSLREGHRLGMQRYLATGVRRQAWNGVVVQGLRKDGSEFPVEIAFGEYTRNGVRYFTAVIRDVTARTAAEEARRASEARLRTYNGALVEISRYRARTGQAGTLQNLTRTAAHALDVDTVGVWLLDAEGTALVCADQYDRATGLHTAGMTCAAADHAAAFQVFAGLPGARHREEDMGFAELLASCLGRAGSDCRLAAPVWLSGRVGGVLVPAADRPDCRWHIEDRTFAASLADHVALALEAADRRAAEQEVRASEARLGQILDAVPAGVVVTDAAGARLYENAAAARILGPTADDGGEREFLGRGASVFFLAGTDEPCPPERMPILRALQGESVSVDDIAVQHPAGAVPLHIQAAPLGAPPGQVTGVVATFIDISERVKLEERLRLAARMEAVGGLAGGIAHEFNNLLTAIRGNVELMLMDVAPGAPAREDLEEIRVAADRAETLTRQLLAFGRQQILRPRALRLGEAVAGLQQHLARLAGPGIEVVTRTAADAGSVMADPGQIEQVLMHLAVNAREAMPEGGTLSVEVRNGELGDDDRARHPYVREGGEFVEMVVADTGPGIPPAVQPRIFEPFFTTKPPGEGTGLGLSTVYGIVKQSGGYVWVDSAPGEGCRFRVYLPRIRDEADSREAVADAAAPADAGGQTVLLVEDEPGVRRVAARALRAEGYTVLEAGGVTEGVRLVRQHGSSIRLLITDLAMPDGGGRTLVDTVRQGNPTLKVLYMSGHTAEAVLNPRVDFERADFLQKPFTPRELCDKARAVLRRTFA